MLYGLASSLGAVRRRQSSCKSINCDCAVRVARLPCAHDPSRAGLLSLHNPVASPNQVLTHAARAAAKQLPLVAARGAREGLWLEQPCGLSDVVRPSFEAGGCARRTTCGSRCARPGGTLHSEATVRILSRARTDILV